MGTVSVTPTLAKNLRRGDIVMYDGYPADILEVFNYPSGAVVLFMTALEGDKLAFYPDAVIDVLGHFHAR